MRENYDQNGRTRPETDEDLAFFEIGREMGLCQCRKMQKGPEDMRPLMRTWKDDWKDEFSWLDYSSMELQKMCLPKALAEAERFGWSDEHVRQVRESVVEDWQRTEERLAKSRRSPGDQPLQLATTPPETKQHGVLRQSLARLQGVGRTFSNAIQRASDSSSSAPNAPPHWKGGLPAGLARLAVGS